MTSHGATTIACILVNFVQCITLVLRLFEQKGHYDITPPFLWDLFSQCVFALALKNNSSSEAVTICLAMVYLSQLCLQCLGPVCYLQTAMT